MVANAAPRELSDAEVFGAPGSPRQEGELSDAEVFGAAQQEKPGIGGAFTGAISRGLQQTWGLAYEGLPALVYSAIGDEETAAKKLAELQTRFQKAERENPTLVASYKDIDSPTALATYVAEAVGENLPSMIPGLGAAGVGLKAGQMMARSAATRAASGMVGMTAGAVTGSAAQNIPETFADVAQETGQQRPGVAMAFGGLKAGLDAIPSIMALKRAFGPAIADKIAGNILKRMGVGAAEQFAAEGATEGAQEALDIAASKYVDENRELFTSANVNRIIDAGLKGGLGGAALGAGTGMLQRTQAEQPPAQPPEQPPPMLALPSPDSPRPMTPEEVTRARAAMGMDWEPSEPNVSKDRFPLTEPVKAQATADIIRNYEMPGEAAPAAEASDKFTAYQTPVDEEGNPLRAKAPHPVDQNPEERAVETEMRVARKSAAYQSARHYTDLTHQMGEDPGDFVARYVPGVSAKQFQEMPIPVRNKVVEMAVSERGRQEAPAPTYNVQDTSGEGPTSAAPAPMREAQAAPLRGAAENPAARVQPTSAEIDATGGQKIERGAPPPTGLGVGGSERPFQGGTQDSSGLDFSRDQQGNPVDPRAGHFEQRAQERAAAAKAAQQEEMQRKQDAYNNAREARRRPNVDAENAYRDSKDREFVSTPKDLDKNGDYPIDQWGFVVSTGGGPMRFTDSPGKSANMKAGLWIKAHGQRRSKYQVFERANHPSGKGIGIVVTGRNEPPGGAGPGKYGVPARTGAQATNKTNTTPRQPPRPSAADAEGVAPVSPSAPSGAAPISPDTQPPSPVSPQETAAPAPESLTDEEYDAMADGETPPPMKSSFALGQRPSETRAASPGGSGVGATLQERPSTSQARQQATDSLRQILRRLAGDKIDVKVVDRIIGDDANFDDAAGYFSADEGRRMIYIAMGDPDDMAAVLRHETIHALRDLGIIGPKEWRALENQAGAWRKKYETDKYYGGLGLSQEKLNEEAIAEAYADWMRGQYKPTSVIENVFRQIKAFFEALRNWAQGNGWNTAADVFEAIEGGGMSKAEFDRTPITRNNAFAMSRAAMTQQAHGVLDAIKNIGSTMDRLNNPLVTLPGDWRNYFEMRGMAKGEIQRIQDHLAGMRDLIGLPKAERDAALRYMTTKGASPTLIQDPKQRAKFIELKQEIVKLGQALVDAGMLNEAVYRQNKDSYLPRLYLRYLLDDGKNRKGVGTGARVSQQGYLKERKDIPEDIRKLLLGEIDDPGFLAVRSVSVVATDLAKFKLLQQISDNPDWVANPKDQFVEWKGKRYTAQALKAEADQLRQRVDDMPEDRRAAALKLAMEMEKLAQTKLKAQPEFSKDYKQIPDTARYGSLRGTWVRKEIHSDLIGTFAIPNPDPSWAEQLLDMGGWAGAATRWWKFAKVVANPPSVFRNAMSGMIQANLFGRVPFAYLPMRYTQAFNEIMHNGKHWQIAQKYGIRGSGFSQNESAKIERDFLLYQKRQGGTPTARQMARFKDMLAVVTDKASDGYQFVESLGKVAVIIDGMKRQGLNERDAVILAEEAEFDYGNVLPSVRYLRNSPIGAPFISYSSKVLPQLIKTAATRPWAFLPYGALIFGLPMLTRWMLDIDEDEFNRLNKTMSEAMRENGSVYILPMRDSAGRWHMWNASSILPWGQFHTMANKLAEGKVGDAARTMGIFGAPLAGLIVAFQTGIDPFTQKPISNKSDPWNRQMQDRLIYLWSMATPPWVGSTGFAKKIHDAAQDVPVDRQGNPAITMTQALSGVVGISLYGLDPEVSRQKMLAQMDYEISEIKRRRGSVLKDQRIKPADRQAYVAEINDLIRQKTLAKKEYAESTNVPAKLRVPSRGVN